MYYKNLIESYNSNCYSVVGTQGHYQTLWRVCTDDNLQEYFPFPILTLPELTASHYCAHTRVCVTLTQHWQQRTDREANSTNVIQNDNSKSHTQRVASPGTPEPRSVLLNRIAQSPKIERKITGSRRSATETTILSHNSFPFPFRSGYRTRKSVTTTTCNRDRGGHPLLRHCTGRTYDEATAARLTDRTDERRRRRWHRARRVPLGGTHRTSQGGRKERVISQVLRRRGGADHGEETRCREGASRRCGHAWSFVLWYVPGTKKRRWISGRDAVPLANRSDWNIYRFYRLVQLFICEMSGKLAVSQVNPVSPKFHVLVKFRLEFVSPRKLSDLPISFLISHVIM